MGNSNGEGRSGVGEGGRDEVGKGVRWGRGCGGDGMRWGGGEVGVGNGEM